MTDRPSTRRPEQTPASRRPPSSNTSSDTPSSDRRTPTILLSRSRRRCPCRRTDRCSQKAGLDSNVSAGVSRRGVPRSQSPSVCWFSSPSMAARPRPVHHRVGSVRSDGHDHDPTGGGCGHDRFGGLPGPHRGGSPSRPHSRWYKHGEQQLLPARSISLVSSSTSSHSGQSHRART